MKEETGPASLGVVEAWRATKKFRTMSERHTLKDSEVVFLSRSSSFKIFFVHSFSNFFFLARMPRPSGHGMLKQHTVISHPSFPQLGRSSEE